MENLNSPKIDIYIFSIVKIMQKRMIIYR